MWTSFLEYLHQQKPKTNADRIRAMSDEELAEWMMQLPPCEMPGACLHQP